MMRNGLIMESESPIIGIMKTTIDIPDKMLSEAMRNSRAQTKRDAVLAALDEYNRRRRMAKLVRHLGTFKNFMTQQELRQMREMD
jgi:Arc/MetJ family transcription regulator